MAKKNSEVNKIWKIFLERIRDKYKLVILNEQTFEEKLSFRLSRLNVFVLVSLLSILLVFITAYIIAYTSLKEYIPGYTDVSMQRTIYELQIRSDSIERALHANESYLKDLSLVLGGNLPDERQQQVQDTVKKDYNKITDKRSKEDSLFRIDFENQSKYNLYRNDRKKNTMASGAQNLFFFSPLKGIVAKEFNSKTGHFGIGISAAQNDAVKAVQDGAVIYSGWTPEAGNLVVIQHSGNIVSVYKNLSITLRKQGTHVTAGEPVGIVGGSVELGAGKGLEFELWMNGNPVNPKDYIVF